MSALTDQFDRLDSTISSGASIATVRHQLSALREQAEAFENQVTDLKKENSRLKKHITNLGNASVSAGMPDEFIECQGALFKRKPTGGYHLAVYCPACKGPMTSVHNATPFICTKDGTSVNFTGRALNAVMRDLPE